MLRERLQHKLHRSSQADANEQTISLAGRTVSIWTPKGGALGPFPTVVFSHGYHGSDSQVRFLMQAMADDGYLVFAPRHKDAFGQGASAMLTRPDAPFKSPQSWSDTTFGDRRDDIVAVIAALQKDPAWSKRIDWSRLALAGHSLGGYTVLGLGGGWSSWKLPNIKAIVAMSPYAQPFIQSNTLASLTAPVIYEGGTRDFGITSFVRHEGGAFDRSRSPAEYVEFDKAGHFAWTNFNRDVQQQDLIRYYSLAFLDKWVKGDKNAAPERRLPGVTDLRVK